MVYTVKQIASPNHWNGREGHKPLWVILHGTDATTADYDGAYETAGWFLTNGVSTNYVVGRQGHIAQCVQESDAPYANGGVTDNAYTGKKHDPWWGNGVNPNLVTISIEHVKQGGNQNSDPLTAAQQQASFALIYDICLRHGIPMRNADAHGGITGHFSMDPKNRTYCPGWYPWTALWAYLKTRQETERRMELAQFGQADQFVAGHSAYECGFYAVYEAKSMSEKLPLLLTPQEISDKAQAAYRKYNGSNSSSNMNGMSLPQLYALLKEEGMHYQGTKVDMPHIKAWLKAGYPVIVAVAEPCVYDLDLGDRVPYPWTPSGNHVIVLTGLDGTNVLARDAANIIAPNTLRPGPRRYDAAHLARGLVSATAIVPTWKQRPLGDINVQTGVVPTAAPLYGWKDDGETLIAPNGIHVKAGFRKKVLAGGWDSFNVPYEPEHPMDGEYAALQLGTEGTGQLFRDCYLRADPVHGVHFDRVGNALWVTLKLKEALETRLSALSTVPIAVLPPASLDKAVLIQIETLVESVLAQLKGLSI